MLNIDDLALVVDGARQFLQGITEEEMTDQDRRMAAAIAHVTTQGEAAEDDLPVDKITKRRGDWVQTRSKRRFFAFDPLASDIAVEDISYSLANVTRFGGQSPFYPVSIHTWRVANIAECLARKRGADDYTVKMVRAYSMVHDASEAYHGDMQAPIKRHLPRYREMEALDMRAIHERFLLPPPPPEILEVVKMADMLALLIEAEELFPEVYHQWPVTERPHAELDVDIRKAAEIPMGLMIHLEAIRSHIRPLADHLERQLSALLAWTEKEAKESKLPEEGVSSGTSSWRQHIKVSVDVSDPYALPKHLQERIDREGKQG